jgi:UDP-N-acetylglucosamine diphosphorylase / glucose-1-phosphate thymidylyltransferase / UDP-N-acetylgalactosamine diphosphorylase / glucosamine-1-phosphate N-acetyltransferase / galactosamine-1-phosphate N-acetyltransferase
MIVDPAGYIARFAASPLAHWASADPWTLTSQAIAVARQLVRMIDDPAYEIRGDIAIHRSATVEDGAVIKGPATIGPGSFVAAGAYVRDGCWLEEAVILGPGAELKSSFVFRGSKLAHFNFVGDSVLGESVNLEAGSIVANYRNEREDKQIRFRLAGLAIDTGVDKFGALIGDGARVGANAVIAPGAVLAPGTLVPRLALLDQT